MKKNIVWPQFVKNDQGKTTHVYIPIEAYEIINKELEEYEKIKKKEDIRWIKVTSTKKMCRKTGKK
ncbi:MAG: hypothetical protein V1855_03490 [bacterium]